MKTQLVTPKRWIFFSDIISCPASKQCFSIKESFVVNSINQIQCTMLEIQNLIFFGVCPCAHPIKKGTPKLVPRLFPAHPALIPWRVAPVPYLPVFPCVFKTSVYIHQCTSGMFSLCLLGLSLSTLAGGSATLSCLNASANAFFSVL